MLNAGFIVLKIHFFDLLTLTFDLWPWYFRPTLILCKLTAMPNFVTLGQLVQSWEYWKHNALGHWRNRKETHTKLKGRALHWPNCQDNLTQWNPIIAMQTVQESGWWGNCPWMNDRHCTHKICKCSHTFIIAVICWWRSGFLTYMYIVHVRRVLVKHFHCFVNPLQDKWFG